MNTDSKKGHSGESPGKAPTVLVLGATGQTGRRLVAELLSRGCRVRALVRNAEAARAILPLSDGLALFEGGIAEIDDAGLAELLRGCGAVASCLGHNLTLRGLFGKPRFLVADAVTRLCAAACSLEPATPLRFVLMSSTGVGNPDLPEARSLAERAVFCLLRRLLPPQRDNEAAAERLRSFACGAGAAFEWVAVRPDSLTLAAEIGDYEALPSPTRSPMFDPGHVARIEVAHFMAALLTEEDAWSRWKGMMPVLYGKSERRKA